MKHITTVWISTNLLKHDSRKNRKTFRIFIYIADSMAPVLTDDFAIIRLSRNGSVLGRPDKKSEIQRPVIHKIELLYWLHLFVNL